MPVGIKRRSVIARSIIIASSNRRPGEHLCPDDLSIAGRRREPLSRLAFPSIPSHLGGRPRPEVGKTGVIRVDPGVDESDHHSLTGVLRAAESRPDPRRDADIFRRVGRHLLHLDVLLEEADLPRVAKDLNDLQPPWKQTEHLNESNNKVKGENFTSSDVWIAKPLRR
ncbi:hypothetical protein HPP92_020283 [Vanilla planifolia]|uniref:Uncharacterized protein n=1 Tax=Vanilla planifolia TaxID=51239 RepID=A0A835Q2H3_VANPL|nr:hypothetical protein HPP92_020283 [Vanilla planifolia]